MARRAQSVFDVQIAAEHLEAVFPTDITYIVTDEGWCFWR